MNEERYAMEIESNPLKDYIKDLLKRNAILKEEVYDLNEKLNKEKALSHNRMLINNDLLNEQVKLRTELQAYKDKEDKLREYISNIDNWNWKKLEGRTNQINRDDILQILNEGSDE